MWRRSGGTRTAGATPCSPCLSPRVRPQTLGQRVQKWQEALQLQLSRSRSDASRGRRTKNVASCSGYAKADLESGFNLNPKIIGLTPGGAAQTCSGTAWRRCACGCSRGRSAASRWSRTRACCRTSPARPSETPSCAPCARPTWPCAAWAGATSAHQRGGSRVTWRG